MYGIVSPPYDTYTSCASGYLPVTVVDSTYGYKSYLIASSSVNYQLYNSSGISMGYADTLANALSSVISGDTIKALQNNTSGAVTNSKNITFNTNGKTITMTGILTNNGTMTVNGGGTITGSVVLISNNGTLTTSSVTIVNNNSDWIMYSSGTYTSSSGTVLRNTVSRGIAFYKGTINIDGGTIDVGMAAIAKDAWSTNNGTIKISGGTIIGGLLILFTLSLFISVALIPDSSPCPRSLPVRITQRCCLAELAKLKVMGLVVPVPVACMLIGLRLLVG